MNYYEELGVPSDAPIEEIRAAYKTLAKIFHPDAQPDPTLKAAGEREMRRLNEIVATLADPVRRMAYDAGLHPEPVLPPAPNHVGVAYVPAIQRVYWHDHLIRRQVIWAGTSALAICGCVWAYLSSEARVTPPAPRQYVDQPNTDQAKLDQSTVPGEPVSNADAQKSAPASGGKARPANGLTGSWLFLGTRTTESGGGPAIESVQFYLAEQNGTLFGRYSARYRPIDAPAPDTTFSVTGRASDPGSAALSWASADGSTGTVKLALRSPDALSLSWWTNETKRKLPVSSGSVLLSRLK